MNIWYGLGVDGGAPRLRCKAAKAMRMPCWTDVCPASLTACLCKALHAVDTGRCVPCWALRM